MSQNHSAPSFRPRIALTLGDLAGVGPELAVKLLADPKNRARADLIVVADKSEVDEAVAGAHVTLPPITEKPGPESISICEDGSAPSVPIPRGKPSKQAGERALHQLRRAIELVNKDEADAIVFTPLNKTSLHDAGMDELDQLRWFATHLHYDGPTSEINISPTLWTSRVTSHVALKDVSSLITKEGVIDSIKLLNTLLSDYGIANPRLGVCGLNPHNGENGHFGREEIDVIRPAVESAASEGINVKGPFPSDTIFVNRAAYDGIVTMFHDQGQIAMKVLGFDGGVTVEGGLPVIIATPGHGTAFDIVGKNLASIKSSQNALDVAIAVASRQAARRRATASVSTNKGSAIPASVNGATAVTA